MQIVYASEDNDTLYLESEVDYDSVTKIALGYTRYEILDTIKLTAEQCCGSYGSIVEILLKANQMKQTLL